MRPIKDAASAVLLWIQYPAYYIFPNHFCNKKMVIITETAKILTYDSQASGDARPRL